MKFLYIIFEGEIVLGEVVGVRPDNGTSTQYIFKEGIERLSSCCFETFDEAQAALLGSSRNHSKHLKDEVFLLVADLGEAREAFKSIKSLTINDVRVL